MRDAGTRCASSGLRRSPPRSPASAPSPAAPSSTIYQRQELALCRVVEAVADLPVRALLLAGKRLDVAVPERVRLERWLSHAAVMPAASLCVTHGGCGTTMSALAHGMPLIVMPHRYEQALNGLRVTQVGAGKLVPAEAAAGEIRESLLEVLAQRA